MNATQLIAKKRDGGTLTDAEIAWLIDGYVADRVPDYQMSAFAMAVYLRGMTTEETVALTRCMLYSGDVLTWAPGRSIVDKHSTGGIGDKVSLILAPLLACCDVRVPMISGRGLGPTGGTLDKLESIPGFRTDLSTGEFQRICDDVGCVISGATVDLVPADRKLYALRDVTATVSCIPLITASIMSKKLAEGLDALVLDVKYGSGAFMENLADARRLAQGMVAVGQHLDVTTSALITDMDQPLGRMIGNSVEVNESIDVLQGGGPADVRELTLALAAEVLLSVGMVESLETAMQALKDRLDSGRAFEKFAQMVAAQGGDVSADRRLAPISEVAAPRSGVVQSIITQALGFTIIAMGGGRKVQGDTIDHSVGIEILVRVGDRVEQGQPIARIFAQPHVAQDARMVIQEAIDIGEGPVEPRNLIEERIT
ncbi:MAG: thymidine phosphorylase [Planctomycetaceae bacterium]